MKMKQFIHAVFYALTVCGFLLLGKELNICAELQDM